MHAFRRALLIIPLAVLPLPAQAPAPAPPVSPTELAAAIRTGDGRTLGDALQYFAHRQDNDRAFVASVAELLGDPSADVKARAALTLGAMGPVAASAAPRLRALLRDPSDAVRREAAFAIGGTGAMDESTIDAILDLLARDTLRSVRRTIRNTAVAWALHRPLTLNAEQTRKLTSLLHERSADAVVAALDIIDAMDAPWKLDSVKPLLSDPRRAVRGRAGMVLAALGPQAESLRPAIERMRGDTVAWVRFEADRMLRTLAAGRRPPIACAHRVRHEGPGPAEFVLLPTSESLRDDGRGSYANGPTVRAVHGHAFNLYLPYAPGDASGGAGGTPPPPGEPSRWMSVDLSKPVDERASRVPGVLRDSALTFHAFFMTDARGYIWDSRDIPVGARIRSDHATLHIGAGATTYFLQFGAWPLGICGPQFGAGHGEGTTPVIIERTTAGEFRFTAPRGSIGRLWDYTNPVAAKDLGLFRFSFDAVARMK